MNWIGTFAVGALLVAATGCGAGGSSVTGTVTLEDGTPVTNGRIIFTSKELNLSANGSINADGTYELSTYEMNDGAPEGNYQVTITAMQRDQRTVEITETSTKDRGRQANSRRVGTMPKPLIHPKYGNSASSGLTAEVKLGRNEINFQVEGPK